jgi:hypothetical protein
MLSFITFVSDVGYRNACWLKKDITGKYSKNEAISGPKKCEDNPDPGGSCCNNVYFGSTGSLAESEQNHVIGYYGKTTEGTGGRWNYKQQGGSQRLMWFNTSLQVGLSFSMLYKTA